MDVWIDGQKAAEGFAFRKALSDLSLLRIAVYRQPTALLLDDLMMYLHPDDGGAVVNTGNQQDQNTKAYCKITRYESKPRGALAVTDMTDAYKDYAKSAVRGVLFTNNRRSSLSATR